MRRVIVLLAVIGATCAVAPLPYLYEQQIQQQVHHKNQLSGFRPSHGYPCPDGIVHHITEGRIASQHETSGEPILAQPVNRPLDKQVTVNSKIAFGEHSHSHGEFISSPSQGYVSPKLSLASQPLPIQHQHSNFHGSGSIVNGIGKATPPFALNQQHYIQHHQTQEIPVQQYRPLSIRQQAPLSRPPPQFIPPRQSVFHQNNFIHNMAHSNQAITGSLIVENLIPPPVGSTHGNFLEHNQLDSSGPLGSYGSVHAVSESFGGLTDTGVLNTISTGINSFEKPLNQNFGSLDASSSNSLGFTSIGSTHNFNHPSLDEGLSQVISETFANAGVGENVEKHIYVHVPPDDLEERDHHYVQQQFPVPQPKKHYKIIFIKAPNQQQSTNVYTQIAQQQATQEKTLVYVLVKKPDEPTIEDIQQIQSTYKPSKPEVYFIKYKTHKDHEEGSNQNVDNADLTNGNFQGSDLSGVIDIRSSFNGENNNIHIIEPRIPTEGNFPSPVYGPPEKNQ